MFRRLARLKDFRHYYTVKSNQAHLEKNSIPRQLASKIKATGPITVADYMKHVLINPLGGYYMTHDVFGKEGDFITSPELSQMFGEMIAIWFLNEWSKIGSPKPIQIIELGPGRGTLVQDVLRVFDHFRALTDASVHLIEVSPFLSEVQAKRLCASSKLLENDSAIYREGVGTGGIPVRWYRDLRDVPNGFSVIIAHEFFDALPIHKFQRTENGYREVLIDVDGEKEGNFRYVLSRGETVASRMFVDRDEKRGHFEISPESLVLVKEMALRIENHGGLGLVADYGHEGGGTDTFRAFKKHALHDPLVEPGSADLTADVDFARLKKAATEEDRVLVFGPAAQRDFLLRMGIEHRVTKLEASATKKQQEALRYAYEMITDPEKMGNRFKFLCLLPTTIDKILKRYPVTGFLCE